MITKKDLIKYIEDAYPDDAEFQVEGNIFLDDDNTNVHIEIFYSGEKYCIEAFKDLMVKKWCGEIYYLT